MTERQKSKKKLDIIHSAIKCFNQYGIEQTKIVDIAKEAQVNHSLVLYYFPNYEDIVMAVTESLIQELNDATIKAINSPHKDSLELLRNYIESTFKLVKKNKDKFTIWLHFYYKASQDNKYNELNKSIRNQARERISEIVKSCSSENLCKNFSDDELADISNYILGLITGNLIVAMTEDKEQIDYYSKLTYDFTLNCLN
jgi:AcrR family transcriptional regulator